MRKTRFLLMAVLAMLGVVFGSCEKNDNDTNGDNNAAGGTRYTLTVQSNNAAWGTATGSGTYADGTRVDIEAVPASGYYFIKWSDGAVSNPRTITVSSDLTLYALFSSNPNDPNPYNPANGNGNNGGNNNGGNNGSSIGDYVDLGLPSGLLWATRNVGANSPEDYGSYFAWGETQPKSVYNWETYKYCNGDYDRLTKYCNQSELGYNGFTDGLTTLQSGDDAAAANWGSGWRTPTAEEWEELIDNCEWTWTTHNGVNGYCVTGRNGGVLFLPAAGGRWDDELSSAGNLGYYWSSSLNTDDPLDAWGFYFNSDIRGMLDLNRDDGFSVRPVRSAR